MLARCLRSRRLGYTPRRAYRWAGVCGEYAEGLGTERKIDRPEPGGGKENDRCRETRDPAKMGAACTWRGGSWLLSSSCFCSPCSSLGLARLSSDRGRSRRFPKYRRRATWAWLTAEATKRLRTSTPLVGRRRRTSRRVLPTVVPPTVRKAPTIVLQTA